jgi:NADH-quinone oxidoreductase subunit E
MENQELLKALLPSAAIAEIELWIAKYPADRKRSAVMAALRIAQDHLNHLSTETMDAIAAYLGIPNIAVYEVATFYSMYQLKPVGKHVINVCTNVSCMLRGSDKIVDHVQKKLGIGFKETTSDGKFTLREVECLAACGGAPCCQIDKTYHENLTPEKIDQIISELE